ncbi:ABC transporter ATP-binding protein [Clostridia bacterium]|nr:ABC transporter ATP-binding protein [Clostridia bacterium]
MSLIEIIDVCKLFKTSEEEFYALKNININIKKGELVAIIGQSGSGKSTLMNILGCLDTPTTGTYFLNGKDISETSENKLSEIRNKEIGFIFQSFNLVPSLSALENVELPLTYRKIPRIRRKALAMQALEKVGLQNRMNHRPSQLSGGQQQRVAIARAIAASPPIILADEPTGNLDAKSGKEIINILFDLHNIGKTIILITHDDTLANLAPRKFAIFDGEIEEKIPAKSKFN